MAKIYGLELKAVRTEECEDNTSIRLCSLYLGRSKLATLLFEQQVPEGENSLQVFVRYPYSEEKLRRAVSALRPEGEYTLEALLAELDWLNTMEHEYLSHVGVRSGGMLAMQFEGGQVTMGIPTRYTGAGEEEILAGCRNKIAEYEAYYGTLHGYRIFRGPEDFLTGEALREAELRA